MASQLYIFVLFAFVSSAYSESLNITSPPVTNWGTWGAFERCPEGKAAQGFQLRTQPFQGVFGDDTAVNGLRLFCGDPFNQTTPTLTSNAGSTGNWGSTYSCYPGFVNGFQLRVETYQGSGDDTATNNMRIFCSNAADPNQYIEGDGLNFGIWGETRRCFSTQAIAGLQTQVEDCDSADDCTALNNILTECRDA
ncbi:Vitelline membrane outer layer protein 1 [Orchesella cincta]|uniref:Vitelline membrane outer layer protein 1 n=1 Tax=Orchesella cincta TaxID=48709 RepID=A0A1D2MGS9_ORCCI|nr:Vitelline membrane outer layer protein 1 [Orchesella cincta]